MLVLSRSISCHVQALWESARSQPVSNGFPFSLYLTKHFDGVFDQFHRILRMPCWSREEVAYDRIKPTSYRV